MAKDKSRKDISPGKKPGPLTKKERKERKKKRKEKHPKWLFLHLFILPTKNMDWFYKAIDVYGIVGEGVMEWQLLDNVSKRRGKISMK